MPSRGPPARGQFSQWLLKQCALHLLFLSAVATFMNNCVFNTYNRVIGAKENLHDIITTQLTLMSYLWGHVKDVVYANEVPTCEEL
jgi:hypothetical protein